jgi:DNA-binding transcriptional regulator YhcF (GntR family)
MRDIFEQIHELEGIPGITKNEQLVLGIINAINDKVIVQGDMLPSVNQMIKEVGFARETIARGYKELVKRGIVESKNRHGFFVSNNDTDQFLKVALLLFAFETFHEVFYKKLRTMLGKNAHIDVFFHHNNIEVFETTISNIKGKFGMYIIAPIPHPKTKEILKVIPLNKFLMIDRYEPIEGDFSHVTQEFEESTYNAFVEIADTIKSFGELVFYYRPASDTPIEILNAYKRFIKNYGIKGTIKTEYEACSIEKGKVYFTINNTELWAMLRDIKLKGLELGTDVGVLSHNDDIIKEIICDGITTYSTDFNLMAEKAANYVLTREKIQETIPTVLIKRNSLR